MQHEKFMKRALEIALNGTGFVSPNPRVGAVLVKNGEIISEGWHRKYGGFHAEVEAIENYPLDNFDDVTLYVTLEPCNHQGKTPPCTELIIEKGIKHVVFAASDPNPEVEGNGAKRLAEAGINVERGVLEKEALWQSRFFFKYVKENAPWMIVKTGQTMDACIAVESGESKWITSEESRKKVHELRHEVDAVMIGRRTALKDNPKLTVRNVIGRDPLRVVIDSKLSLPVTLKLFNDENRENTIVAYSVDLQDQEKMELLESSGVKTLPSKSGKDGLIDLVYLNKILAKKYSITSILVEGGNLLHSDLARLNLIDEIQLFIAPKLIGNGIKTFSRLETAELSSVKEFEFINIEMSGSDIHLIASRKNLI